MSRALPLMLVVLAMPALTGCAARTPEQANPPATEEAARAAGAPTGASEAERERAIGERMMRSQSNTP